MPKNLSGFISRISGEFPDQVVSVRRPIRVAEYEITAVLQHLDDAGEYPMTIFEQPINQFGDPSEFPIVSNVFGTRERCALALDLPPQQSKLELSLEYARLDRRQIAPEIIAADEAPVKEVVQLGDAIDIRVERIERSEGKVELSPP